MSGIRLSSAKFEDIQELAKLASEGNLIEMRNKHGILLYVGRSISELQNVKDRRGNKMYSVIITKELRYDHVVDIIHHDVTLDVYKQKSIKTSNERLQSAIDRSESYWANRLRDKSVNV